MVANICSSVFIDEYFSFVAKAPSALVKTERSTRNRWHDTRKHKIETPEKMYARWVRDLYAEHAPEKLDSVSVLLKKYKGKEYELYVRACGKYGVSPEPEPEPSPVRARRTPALLAFNRRLTWHRACC